MSKKKNFGCADIPMLCSLFLEPALEVHKKYLPKIPEDIKKYIHEWNIVLIDTVKMPNFQDCLGDYGKQVLNALSKTPKFTEICVKMGQDTKVQALQYAIRFSNAINFLSDTVQNTQNNGVIDYGCGLTPLCASIQSTYNFKNAHCMDENGKILEIYETVANIVSGHSPSMSEPIIEKNPYTSWKLNKHFVKKNQIDSLVAIGVFPYIKFEQQLFMLYFIEKYLKNFFIEIKYQVPDTERNTQIKKYNISAVPPICFNQQNFLTSRFTEYDKIITGISKPTLDYLNRFARAAGIGNTDYLKHIRTAFVDSRYLPTLCLSKERTI